MLKTGDWKKAVLPLQSVIIQINDDDDVNHDDFLLAYLQTDGKSGSDCRCISNPISCITSKQQRCASRVAAEMRVTVTGGKSHKK